MQTLYIKYFLYKNFYIADIREASGLTSGILTPYLKSLKDKGIISKDSSVKRNTKYFIKDPLFRKWLKKETL